MRPGSPSLAMQRQSEERASIGLQIVLAVLGVSIFLAGVWCLSLGIEKSKRIALMEQESVFVVQAGGTR